MMHRSSPPTITEEDYAAAELLAASAKPMPCAYCDIEMVYDDEHRRPTRDHIWPRDARSMENGRVGKVWCCAECNVRKAHMMPSEWLKVVREMKAGRG